MSTLIRFDRYLFVGEGNLDKLNEVQYSLDPEVANANLFTTLFPNLVLLLCRLPEHHKDMMHPQHARQYVHYRGLTTTTKIWLHVHAPIKPSLLAHACVMGRDHRETHVANSCISNPRKPACDTDISAPGDTDYDPRLLMVTDSISRIRFLPKGELSSETDRTPQVCFSGDNLLQIETEHLDDNDSEDSRSRNIAKGVLALYSEKLGVAKSLGSAFRPPLITLVGTQVPLKPFVTEVSYFRSSPILDYCLQVSSSATTTATIEGKVANREPGDHIDSRVRASIRCHRQDVPRHMGTGTAP